MSEVIPSGAPSICCLPVLDPEAWTSIMSNKLGPSLTEKVKLESYYMENKKILLNIKIIYLTIIKVLKKDNIKH